MFINRNEKKLCSNHGGKKEKSKAHIPRAKDDIKETRSQYGKTISIIEFMITALKLKE